MEHATPLFIADLIADLAPNRINRLLEPSAGSGALLMPLICKSDVKELVLVDVNQHRLEMVVKKAEKYVGNIKAINGDFIEYANCLIKQKLSFDCVVMNPPFSGRLETHVTCFTGGKSKKVPIEVQFLNLAFDLLDNNGYILAVVPPSVIVGESSAWLREKLLANGSIVSIIELHQYLFKKVEALTYILTYKKGPRSNNVILKSLDTKEMLEVPSESVVARGDFSYHKALLRYKDLMNYGLIWTPLQKIAEVFRGTENSPGGIQYSVHSTNYSSGFWIRNRSLQSQAEYSNSNNVIKLGDLLIKRVSRKCSTSLGIPLDLNGLPCTDCVIIVRPRKNDDRNKILFAFRCLSACTSIQKYLERGISAKFISKTHLDKMCIPTDLHNKFPKEFREYESALTLSNHDLMKKIENHVSVFLGGAHNESDK